MFLRVQNELTRERRWYGTPLRGPMRIGAEAEGDVQLAGHNIAARHVVLHFDRRIRIEVKKAYAVRIDGQLPRADAVLGPATDLEIGPWHLGLEFQAPSGIDPIDEAFLGGLADPDERSVYADALEDRGRVAEAALMRAPRDEKVDPALAVRAPPEWRRRFLPIAIENCAVVDCPRDYRAKCEVCKRDIPLYGHIADAREHALKGHPVAVDPAVRRWENDLRAPVVRQPRIVMGQPTRR